MYLNHNFKKQKQTNITLMDFSSTGAIDWDWSISNAVGGGSRMVPSSFYNVNTLSDNF